MSSKEATRVEGVYAVPRLAGEPTTVLMRVPKEDKGKIEGIAGTALRPVDLEMSGIVTGKKDPKDATHQATASREFGEEYGEQYGGYKPPEAFTNGLPPVEINQVRDNQLLLFFVLGHRFTLTPEEVARIHEFAPTMLVQDSALSEFLRHPELVRPAVHGILSQLVTFLEQGHKI